MEIIAIIFIALIFGVLVGCIILKLRGRAFARRISSCPACGQEGSVSPDPENSRLVLQCKNGACGSTSFRHVRASALSLFGLSRFVLVFLVVLLSDALAEWLDWNGWGRVFVILAGLLMGWIVVSFLIRLCAHVLLEFSPSPILQNEIVAHLAPPSFWQGQQNRKRGPNPPARADNEL
jgi:hypothetical protein